MELTFTKFNTVKFFKTEMANERFFKDMCKKIDEDVNLYGVYYDLKKDRYTIVYNGDSYDVKFGDKYLTSDCTKWDIATRLDSLALATNNILTLKRVKQKKEVNEMSDKEDILKKADNGVLRTNDEKIKAIKALSKESKHALLKNLKRVFELLKKNNYSTISELPANIFGWAKLVEIGVSIMVGIPILFSFIVGSSPAWLAITVLVVIADCLCIIPCWNSDFTRDGVYFGIFGTLLSILALPFHFVYSLIKTVVDIITIKFKKHEIKNSIIDKQKAKNINLKINVKNISKALLYLEKTDNVNTTKLSEQINELKNSILNINNNKIKTEYKNKLLDILNKYFDSVVDNDTKNELLNNQIIDLKIKVENELIKEENEKGNQAYFYKLMNEVKGKKEDDNSDVIESSHQKSIGRR